MDVKELTVAIVITLLLIVFFSLAGYTVKELCFSRSGVPTTSGDTGVTVLGNGSEPAEITQQTTTPEEATPTSKSESDTVQESTTEQTENEPTITTSEEQKTNRDLVCVFLSGVASVLFVELIVLVKSKI